ncbi:MAG: hypothetical protein V4437_01240 [Patescibacteria group bacterium]
MHVSSEERSMMPGVPQKAIMEIGLVVLVDLMDYLLQAPSA